MIKVQVNRKRWLRGEDAEKSYLLRESDGKSCCMGFFERKRGAKKRHILGKKSIQTVEHCSPLRSKFKPYNLPHMSSYDLANTITLLYQYNDSPNLSDDSREVEIIRLGKAVDIEFKFVG